MVLAKRRKPDQALAALELALEHTDADAVVVTAVRAGVEALRAGDPGKAKTQFDSATKVAPELPLLRAGADTAMALARTSFEEAKALSYDDPARAMVLLARLAPFKKDLRRYKETRRSLLKRAFRSLLREAEAKARDGSDAEAAELLATALEVAKPPKKIMAPLLAGTTAVRSGDYLTAERVFDRILKSDGKSRLARTGKKIARLRRLANLRKEAREAKEVDDPIRAAAAYQAILDLDKNDFAAREAIRALRPALVQGSVQAAHNHRQNGKNGAAFIYYRRALDLDADNVEAKQGISELKKQFKLRKIPLAYVAPVVRGKRLGDKCAGAEEALRGRIILYLTRSRNLGAEFLASTPTQEVDTNKRPKPSLQLVSALEHCGVNDAGGQIVATMQVKVGTDVLYQGRVEGKFDKSSLPKDELEGINADRVLNSALASGAKEISKLVSNNAKKLNGWRVTEARAQMRANDADAVARVYAVLRIQEDSLTPQERVALQELERFILNRFR